MRHSLLAEIRHFLIQTTAMTGHSRSVFCEEWQFDHDEMGGSGDRSQMMEQEKPRKE